jgi:hypothetical protein
VAAADVVMTDEELYRLALPYSDESIVCTYYYCIYFQGNE